MGRSTPWEPCTRAASTTEENRARLAAQIRPLLEEGEIVGLPAVLGLDDLGAWRDLADKLGHPVFEIPIQPPSIPRHALERAADPYGFR